MSAAVNMEKKHLSSIANHVLSRCAQKLDTAVDSLLEEFKREWDPQMSDYSKKLVEFCCLKVLPAMCINIDENICDGSFNRFTFDMMRAWEMPSSAGEESYTECMAKEREEKKVPIKTSQEQDDVSLFYSDLMPLLVDHESSVGEEAYVWLATFLPLVADVINGRFTFETLTAPTANQLHFPAYDQFLKEINKCIKHLQKQETPTGVTLADDEFILHVEGTAGSQRVVRHIGGTSWPGRLTLTNYALYFEASGVISHEDALKLDLTKGIEKSLKPAATGPWGAPIFDKAILYECSELQEGVVLEFPEMTSSTRRHHWLALVKEIMSLHQFLSKFNVESPLEGWEMHARTILGIIRLHAAREMLRISPPIPKSFLIFALLDELPKGDYILEELAKSLKKVNSTHPCSASSILRNLNVSQPCFPCLEMKEVGNESEIVQHKNVSSLESAVNHAKEEAKEMDMAKASAEGLKEDGISESAQVLMGLLEKLKNFILRSREIYTWKRPITTLTGTVATLIVLYKEWIGQAIAAFLFFLVATMLLARLTRSPEKQDKIVICTGSNQTTMESIVSAQQGLRTIREIIRNINISILKIWSILVSKAPKHTQTVMIAMSCGSILFMVVPFKIILMALVSYGSMMASPLGKRMQNEQSNRRLKEWILLSS
ncbi:uncharacterized protein LOC111366320 isoform X2 [Olea europaea var. sylvestris]|uniref:uncharacterized protein LOC111366320 isoform X2 n=1 Tax=Olea europaea var. sylvestris TaxID=158386 RepID=UPI000C1D2FB9|nr:uncharacterized protein LOC111366320 isoform X2 [Olea europaea var. sylvestris]